MRSRGTRFSFPVLTLTFAALAFVSAPTGSPRAAGPAASPNALEICNHADDDGDGAVDEGFPALVARQILADRHPLANDRFASSAASLGDVDGDGVADFVVSAPLDDLGTNDGGSVTLYSGATRAVLCRATAASGDTLGDSVAAVGDIDRDGTQDFAAAEPNHDAVAILSGADCSQIARCVDTAAASANLGGDHGLAGFVDLNGDGIPEILAGADHSNTVLHYGGRAVVFTVSATGACSILRTLDDPALAIYAYLGCAVAALTDVTGDGVADIAVGESGYQTYRGAVLVFSGADGSLVRRIVDPAGAANDHFGESLATIGCMDGDGIGELIVGSPRRTAAGGSAAGHVLIFSPEDAVVLRDVTHLDGGNDWLGESIAVVPDLNGDGTAEIVAGARYADTPGGADAGMAVVFSGADGEEIAELFDADGSSADRLGSAVACAGDLNGDGVAEILAGAPYRDGAASDEGRLSIFTLEADCDGDGPGPFGGDCDDTDASVWRVPGEARALAMDPDRRTVRWEAPLDAGNSGAPLDYDLLRAEAPAGFQVASCIEPNDADRVAVDPAAPGAGGGYYYLARAQNVCGEGDLGGGAAGDPRAGATCP